MGTGHTTRCRFVCVEARSPTVAPQGLGERQAKFQKGERDSWSSLPLAEQQASPHTGLLHVDVSKVNFKIEPTSTLAMCVTPLQHTQLSSTKLASRNARSQEVTVRSANSKRGTSWAIGERRKAESRWKLSVSGSQHEQRGRGQPGESHPDQAASRQAPTQPTLLE